MIAIMMNRRDVLAITPLLLVNAAASQAEAQAIQQPRWSPVFQHDLPNLTRCVAKTILRRNRTAANVVGQTIQLSIRGFPG